MFRRIGVIVAILVFAAIAIVYGFTQTQLFGKMYVPLRVGQERVIDAHTSLRLVSVEGVMEGAAVKIDDTIPMVSGEIWSDTLYTSYFSKKSTYHNVYNISLQGLIGPYVILAIKTGPIPN